MTKLKITDDMSADGSIEQLKKYLHEQLKAEIVLLGSYRQMAKQAGFYGDRARQLIRDVARFECQVSGWLAAIEELEVGCD